jgi:hypothetical protein
MENKAAARVFVDDTALTFEYWETVIRKSSFQPEKELMLAVLKDAIMIYKTRIYSGNALFKEAETWLFNRERDRLFSFETVCFVLGFSAEKIRENLLAWKLNGRASLIDRDQPPRPDPVVFGQTDHGLETN